MTPTRKILIVRVGALGDTLMSTPLVSALAEAEPQSQIDFLCSGGVSDVLRNHPKISRVFPLRQRNWPIALSPEKKRLISRLRKQEYDLAVLLESAPRYRELLGKCRIQLIHSFEDEPFDPLQHSSRNHLAVAGFPNWQTMPLRPLFVASQEEEQRAAGLLEGQPRPRVGLHCGYGPPGKGTRPDRLKGWRLANFAALGRELVANGASLVFTGSAADRKSTDQIATSIDEAQLVNLAGSTTIGELGALIKHMDLFISVDSGPAHLAAVVGTPLIVLWGPAKLAQVQPLQNGAPVVILRVPVPCAPCYDTPAMKTCRNNVCMQLIRPHRVYQEAIRLLNIIE